MLTELRQRLQDLQRPAGLADGAGTLPFGIEAVDAALGDGLTRGALHEITALGAAHLAAATGFALGISCSLWPGLSRPSTPLVRPHWQDVDARDKRGHDGRERGRSLVWLAEDMALGESGAPYGPGLAEFALAPERLLTVAVACRRDLLWAMEEALRCRAVAAVIGELPPGALDRVAVRRLSLAAAESGALALLLRAAPADDASTAATRWIVGTAPSAATHSPRFAAQLVRNRRGPLGAWILEWSDSDERFLLATHAQPVAAPTLYRSHRQVA